MQYRGLFIGLTTVDIQYFADKFPKRNVKIKTTAPDILVGGPATNAAVAFSKLNKGAHLATVVGENSFTSFIQNDFQATQLQFADLVGKQKINPIVASVVTSANGDRNIFTHNPPQITPNVSAGELFDKVQPQIVMIDGFYPEFSLNCAKLARKQNIPVVADCGSWKPQYQDLLQYTDVAICSADFFPPECSEMAEIFNYIENLGVINIAISRGEQNIVLQENGIKNEVAVRKVQVLDTLGAGDFLHGAFCYYFVHESDFTEALSKASKLSSFSCTYKGTRQWLNKF